MVNRRMRKLSSDFYENSALQVAQALLGKIFVHNVDGLQIKARIVEVEAYMGMEDKAAHSYGGRRTKRTEVMYGRPGLLYVFFVYGMHHCANVVTADVDVPQAVLIRAAEPLAGMEEMARRRFQKPYESLSEKQKIQLTNGPGKFCLAMGIDKTANGKDLCGDQETLYLEEDGYQFEMVTDKRIGIDYAEEAAAFPYRFYIKDNPYVSVR